jgi:outer membrane protein
MAALLTSCEFTYDPSKEGDAPGSPGSEKYQPFKYRETFVEPFTEEDLSGTMPLSKLLDIALYNNPTTRSSWHAARAAAYAYHVSWSAYYPAVTLIGDIATERTNGPTDINNTQSTNGNVVTNAAMTPLALTGPSAAASSAASSSTSTTSTGAATVSTVFNEITGSYLLLDFGGRNAQTELAFQMLEQANWQHNLAMQQVMLAVLNSYTSYIGNRALVAASEQDLEDAKVALESTKVQRLAGLATLTDVLTAQSSVEQMQFNLEQARGAEKTALATLLITLGLSPDKEISVQDLPEKLPVIEISHNVSALIEMAKEHRPDIGAAIAQVKQQRAQLVISYSSGMPVFTLNATTNQLYFLHPKIPETYNNSVSLNWSTPLFQGFYYLNQRRQIKEQIQEALANVDATVAQVVTAVMTDYYAFTTAEASLPSSEALVESSKRAYHGILSQYKVGVASVVDVTTALTTLSNARAQLVMTRTQWAASLANLAFSVGVLEDTSGSWESAPPSRLYKLQYQDNTGQ